MTTDTRILWLPESDARNWDYESGGWSGGNRSAAGVKIDPESALRATVVLACVRVLSASAAGLPLHLYRRLPGGGKELARDNPLYRVLHETPNDWQTSYEWRETLMLHLLTYGNAYCEIRGAGDSRQLIPLHPSRMKVERLENGRLRYTYREDRGSSTVYSQDAIMHLRWLSDDGLNGLVPVEIARDAIALSRACEIHGASFFGNGARPGVVLTTDQMLSPEAAENTRNQWERAHRGPDRAQRTAVLQGGLKISELGGNNQESQFLESRRFQVEEVCRVYGVPPHLVGDLSRSSFSNIEQQSLDYVQNGLMPWLRRFESAITRDLLTDPDTFAEFDVRGALRADAAGRSSFYNTMAQLGVFSVNEIRGFENLNPVEGGDIRVVPLNMQTLEQANAAARLAMAPAAPVVEEIITVDETPAETVAEATPEPEAEAGPQIADVSLNGAQVSSLLEIVTQYNAGLLNEAGAKAIIAAAFPGIPQTTVNAIIAGTNTTPVVLDVAPPVAATRAAPDAVDTGDFVSWGSGDGRGRGRITRVVRDGEINVPDSSFTITGTEDDPAALIRVYRELADGWAATDVEVGHKFSTLTKIDDLESRAAPDAVDTGDFVSWGSGDGRGRGRITRVVRDGSINVPDSSFTIAGTEEDPAALIRVYKESADGWNATDVLVGHKFSTLTKIDPLESRAAADAVDTGDFVSWGSGDGRGRGRITRVVRDGSINVPDSSFTIEGTEDDPAALIRVYRELADGWNATDVLVGHKFSTLTKIDPLEREDG